MTDYYASLDAKVNLYSFNFVNAYNSNEFVRASSWLYALNSVHPSKAFLKDMPRFTIRSNSLRAKLDLEAKARRYCDYWHPLLEIAMTDFREKNQQDWNRV